jgi:dTDP-4-amino-4,6-dideoxygalactose transaminase
MIQVLDLKEQYLAIKPEIDQAIQGVLENTQFILGKEVGELETSLASYCDCEHGIGVASGTDALRLALTAIGIGPGDEVITTPFTFIATGNTISHCGATPVFVDIDPVTFNIDAEAIEAAITPNTRAIVPVHLFGLPAEMESIRRIASQHNLAIVEDCAQAIGAMYKGRRVGSFGDAGTLSFFPSKNLGAFGDGGMVVTNNNRVAGLVDVLRRHGGKRKYHHELLGFNSRLDTIQAAVLNVKLKYLDTWNLSRRKAAHYYNELLSGLPLTTPSEFPDAYHVYHQYTIRVSRRDHLAAYMKERGVATMVYYPVPLHLQELYASKAHQPLPNAEKAAEEVLSLPMYPELARGTQEFIAGVIREFFANG